MNARTGRGSRELTPTTHWPSAAGPAQVRRYTGIAGRHRTMRLGEWREAAGEIRRVTFRWHLIRRPMRSVRSVRQNP